MKSKYFFSLIVLSLLTCCNSTRENTAKGILESPKMRSEIINRLLSNHNYTTQLISSMNANEMSKQMLSENISIIKTVCQSEKLDSLMGADHKIMESMVNLMMAKMDKDTNACKMMCKKVIESEYMKKGSGAIKSKK